jgi:hypothetical protein
MERHLHSAYVFMAWCLIKHSANITLILFLHGAIKRLLHSGTMNIFEIIFLSFSFFSLALQPQWALAYLHETLRFTSVFFRILDSR